MLRTLILVSTVSSLVLVSPALAGSGPTGGGLPSGPPSGAPSLPGPPPVTTLGEAGPIMVSKTPIAGQTDVSGGVGPSLPGPPTVATGGAGGGTLVTKTLGQTSGPGDVGPPMGPPQGSPTPTGPGLCKGPGPDGGGLTGLGSCAP